MPSLSDIAADLAPAEKTIEVGPNKRKLTLRGLDAGTIAGIAKRFPDFAQFLDNARDARDRPSIALDGTAYISDDPMEQMEKVRASVRIGNVMALGGGAYPAMIAASVGQYNDVEAEKIAASFSFENQAAIVAEIMGLTFSQEQPRPLAGADNSSAV